MTLQMQTLESARLAVQHAVEAVACTFSAYATRKGLPMLVADQIAVVSAFAAITSAGAEYWPRAPQLAR